MKLGKLPPELLDRLLQQAPIGDPRVLLGPKVGEDAAIIDYGKRVLVAKTDPITFATDMIGWYAVQINANDVACCGATPRWFMATLLLPQSVQEHQAQAIFHQIVDACQSLDIALVGGHTEVTQHLTQPIVVGCMLGEAAKSNYVTTSGAREGDNLVVTKGIAIEGTALLARDIESTLRDKGIDSIAITRSKELLFHPGISVVKGALTACSAVTVHSLHDPTEGGLAAGLYEVAHAAKVGLVIDRESVPVLPETEAVCHALGLDPLGLLASGALVIALPSQEVPRLMVALENVGVKGYEIGRVTSQDKGVVMSTPQGTKPIPRFERDELARFFEEST